MSIRKCSHLVIEGVLAVLLIATTGTIIGTRDAEATAQAKAGKAAVAERFVVHEWGTFTSIAGRDGAAVEWRPLAGSSDLPAFVYDSTGLPAYAGLRHGRRCVKCDMEAIVRMETPVIYFYADREITASVKVEFPQGKITEWYPQARLVYNPDPANDHLPSIIDWGRINILPGADVTFPVERGESHYYPARQTDSAPLGVCGSKEQQYEKFLFYRGVGRFDVPLSVTLKDEKIAVSSRVSQQRLTPIILFENRGGQIGYRIYDSPAEEIQSNRLALDQTIDSLYGDLQSILVAEGLYEKEARAMIKTWSDSWFEEGMRVFYVMPQALTKRILPLAIDPVPSELVRVMVGRIEVITPEMQQAVLQKIAAPSPDARSEAMRIIRRYGRFSEPILNNIAQATNDPKLKAKIEQVVKSANVAAR